MKNEENAYLMMKNISKTSNDDAEGMIKFSGYSEIGTSSLGIAIISEENMNLKKMVSSSSKLKTKPKINGRVRRYKEKLVMAQE